MIQKHPVCPDLIRTIPAQFSWVDHRLVRDRHLELLNHEAAALYLFLVTVADCQGLSYYANQSLCRHLSMDEVVLNQARNCLLRAGLVAYKKPLYQVLDLGPGSPIRNENQKSRVADRGRAVMIDYETFTRIKHLHDNMGLGTSQIAHDLGLDQRTVIRWLEEKRFRARNPTIRPSKLDTFKDSIIRMLESYPSYTARQIFQRLLGDGFDGSYQVVKRFVRKVRPSRKSAYLTLAFAPGEGAQVDWGSYGSIRVGDTQRRLSFFVMVLCSRQMYVEFTVSQTMEHFLACHANAFAAFGGVPAKIMVDNLKSAVLLRVLGKAPVFNPKYLDFARHYGFDIAPCGVRKPNEKGRVENAVGYVKKTASSAEFVGSSLKNSP